MSVYYMYCMYVRGLLLIGGLLALESVSFMMIIECFMVFACDAESCWNSYMLDSCMLVRA
jgi:hypothetical protein